MNHGIITTYLNYCKTHKRLSSHTLRAYKNDLTQFQNHNKHCIKNYIKQLTKSNIKTNTLKRKIASLKTFYNYLKSRKLIKNNPFDKLQFQFRSEKTLPKTIPYNVLKAIFDHLKQKNIYSKTNHQKQKNERNLLILSLLLSTGIRISELCNIELKNIDILNQTLHIMGKGKKERIIFLGDQVTFVLLKYYIKKYCTNSNTYLFLEPNSKKPLSEQSVRLFLKTIQKQININTPITPHMFRHSFATMLLDNNIDIRYIQQILGHSSISITQIYTHVSQSKQKEILSQYNPISSIHNN